MKRTPRSTKPRIRTTAYAPARDAKGSHWQALQNYLSQRPSIPADSILRK